MRAALLASAACFAILLAACAVDVPGFCCVSEENCAGHGTTEPISCPSGQVCDSVHYTCVTSDGQPTCDQSNASCTVSAPVCTSSGTCSSCSSDDDCGAWVASGAPHCGSSGGCVACLNSMQCTDPTKPVCSTAGACTPCSADGQCDSGACDLGTGECVAEAATVYVAPSGQAGSCAKAQPCATFAQGLAAVTSTRKTILAASGSYSETVSVSSATVNIVGLGAHLQPAALGQPVLVVTDNGHVSVRGLVIENAGGSTTADGVRCSLVTSGSPSISLTGVTIQGCSGKGVNATSCAIDIERSTIARNTAGGIAVSGSTFTLVNDFVVGNGSGSSAFGGISIQGITTAGTHVIDFSTIAQNEVLNGVSAGVDCNAVGVPLAFSDSVVFGNQASGSGKQVGGNMCSWTYSDIADTVAGTGNITGDPIFASPSTGDFHVAAGSPCIDAANPAATVTVDFDGDPRTGRADIGADEYTP